MTAARSEQAYTALCSVLERNDIDYQKVKGKNIRCSISGTEKDIQLIFTIDESKMLVTLYSPVFRDVPPYRATDIALAICMINHSLTDGMLCFDIKEGFVYFKMTSSFYESGLNSSIFEYMLFVSAEIIEKYSPKIKKLINAVK